MVFLSGELLEFPAALDVLPAQGQLQAPVDSEAGDDGVYIADAAQRRVVVLDSSLGYRRVIGDFARPPLAVLPGTRRETETVYVADGAKVVEIELTTDSPLPIFEEFRARLANGDIEGALHHIVPERRERFRAIYEVIGAQLPSEAAAMASPELRELREGRATLWLRRVTTVSGETAEDVYPVELVRSRSGAWQIYDY
jgi:hypothetical protein